MSSLDSKNLSPNDAAFMWRNLLVQHPMCAAKDDWNVRLHEILEVVSILVMVVVTISAKSSAIMELHEVQALGCVRWHTNHFTTISKQL